MRITRIARWALLAGVVAGLGSLGTATVRAASDTIESNVTVEIPIAITGGDTLEFGMISAPTAGTATWEVVIDKAGGVLNPVAPGDSVAFGGHQEGTFDVTGAPDQSYSVMSSVMTDFSAPGLSLVAITTSSLSTGVGSPFLDGTGADTVFVGGTLDIQANTASGLNAGGNPAVVEVTVDYN